MRNRFNADIRNCEIGLGAWDNGQFAAYAKRLGIVQAAKLGRGEAYTFADHASACRYSLWLAKREAVRLPVAMPALTALAA